MTGGHYLTDNDNTTLLLTAQRIYDSKRNWRAVRGETIEGVVKTAREYCRLGSVLGMKFTATVNTIRGERKIEYIVRPGKLEGAKLQWNDVTPDFYEKMTSAGMN